MMLALGKGQFCSRPQWVAPGAKLDLDFEHGRYWDGREHQHATAVSGWLAGPPELEGGLVCDGETNWALEPLPGLEQTGLDLALQVDLTEHSGALDVGYLAILHAGSLANRMAMLTTRSGLTSRITLDGTELFSPDIAQAPGARYQAFLSVKNELPTLCRLDAAPVGAGAVSVGRLHSLGIGGFKSTLPLKGVVHRVTLWAGLTVPTAPWRVA